MKIILLILLIVSAGKNSIYLNNSLNHNYYTKNYKNEIAVADDVQPNMKVYRYSEYGYEVSYPQNYNVVISGGHSPVANPEYEMRLGLYSKDSRNTLSIDTINKVIFRDKYSNFDEFIKYKGLNLRFDEEVTINHNHRKIYKVKGDNYYLSSFENDKYIFQFSSSSKEFLEKIMSTFKFL